MSNRESIQRAKEFATQKFSEMGVRNHFLEVYDILQNEFNIEDETVLTAALLHDTLEDTSTTYEELKNTFDTQVADLVEEVSHPKNYNSEQKKEYYENIKHITWGGKMIKLADFSSHLRKFIGAFTGEGDYPKMTNLEYVVYVQSFLESCESTDAKKTVLDLTKTLEKYITFENPHR